MSPAMQELLVRVPPPAKPNNASGDWKQVEESLGMVLPDDYKEFINSYGSGTLCSLFSIPSPFNIIRFSTKERISPREYWLSWVEIYQDWEQAGRQIAYPVYPSTPGLFPCGRYGDVDILNWFTVGEASQWHIVFFSREHSLAEIRGFGFATFLLAALKGTVPLPEKVLGKHVMDMPSVFEPF